MIFGFFKQKLASLQLYTSILFCFVFSDLKPVDIQSVGWPSDEIEQFLFGKC